MSQDLFGICPYVTAQRVLRGKWSIVILHHLEDGPVRFNELQRRLPEMTHATLAKQLRSLEEYGVMQVKLYEDIARFGHIATTYAYPVKVNGRYVMDPSPIPKFDNPKMDMMPALQLFGAGREKRIYAVPPFTRVESLDFDDHPFTVQQWDEPCAICGSTHSYLDEVVLDDAGNRMFVCSDTDYCRQQSEAKNQ